MMNGSDLHGLAKILGHSNIKMTERCTELDRKYLARTGSTARVIGKLFDCETCDMANIN
jgi:site-specific recombinase XerC